LSLLIVRCPLKPFSGSLSSSPSDWHDLACAEHFEWCLVDDQREESLLDLESLTQFSTGTTDSMPYADEALVLMPTLDVRLIEAKVPLANAKKLQQILPNLIEEYLLGGAESITVQALPPVPGKLALQRTLALIDRAWYAWLTQQLEGLLCQRVRLIPDCFLLSLPTSSSLAPMLAYMRVGKNIVLTKRTAEQLGVAWVEQEHLEAILQLPQALENDQAHEFSWDWILPSAQAFLKESASSKSANFALNLLPKSFKRQKITSNLSRLTSILARANANRNVNSLLPGRLAWTDPVTWREPSRWAAYLLGMMLLGFILHLSWLVFDNWRWASQMNLLAAQSLTTASVSELSKNTAAFTVSTPSSPTTVTGAFIKQVTLDQRRQGHVADADFAPMAAKLEQLKALFGSEILQQIEYDGYGINFEFKSGVVKNPAQVIKAARTLGYIVKPLGEQRYRLEPYAGLGAGS